LDLDPSRAQGIVLFCGFGFWYMYTGGERAYDTRPR